MVDGIVMWAERMVDMGFSLIYRGPSGYWLSKHGHIGIDDDKEIRTNGSSRPGDHLLNTVHVEVFSSFAAHNQANVLLAKTTTQLRLHDHPGKPRRRNFKKKPHEP
jgi:hypothetical protein